VKCLGSNPWKHGWSQKDKEEHPHLKVLDVQNEKNKLKSRQIITQIIIIIIIIQIPRIIQILLWLLIT